MTGGLIGSNGNLEVGFESGLFGAVSGAALGALGGMDPNGGIWGALERGSLEGLVNGTLSAAGGGNFESGFLGAMVGSVGSYEVKGISSGQGDWGTAGKECPRQSGQNLGNP